MIAAIFGTTGELIKLAPVLRAVADRSQPALLLSTGQQVQQIPRMLEDFGLPQPDLWLARGSRQRDLERPRDIPRWLAQIGRSYTHFRADIRTRLSNGETRPLVLVHGDTMTTVLGALMGRGMRVPVAHLEAGLRSGSWRNPFPEELDRRLTSRIAQVHLAPGAWAAQNLHTRNVRGEIIDIGGNTVHDAVDLVDNATTLRVAVPDGHFGLVSVHRFELLESERALTSTLRVLQEGSGRIPLLFVDHPVTAAAIERFRLGHFFGDRFIRIPRQRYFDFVRLMKASCFLVTDSGGSQEECAHLGHPCLIHRAKTERLDGLEGSVVLSEMKLERLRRFLDEWPSYKRSATLSGDRPTDRVLGALTARGFVAPAD